MSKSSNPLRFSPSPDKGGESPNRSLRERSRRLRTHLQVKRQPPLALAKELAALKEQSGLSWSQVEHEVGLSPTHRKLLLSLLALPPDMAAAIGFAESTRKSQPRTGLALKHARSLYLLRDRPEQQRALYDQLRHRQRSANQVLRAVLAKRQGRAGETDSGSEDPNVRAALDRLRYKFGTKVLLRRGSRGGEFILEFYSDEDMQRLYDLLV